MSLQENLEEEVYCLKYELDAMAGSLIHQKGERWIKGFFSPISEKQHEERYELACEFAKDKDVLDMACGTGYGTHLLATKGGAKTVVGVDLDKNAIRYANFRNGNEKIIFAKDDATTLQWAYKFDLIVSFETIEHIPSYTDLIFNLAKLLKENGKIIISTPITRKTTTTIPHNPFHVIEWGFFDFHKLIKTHFDIDAIYLQDIKTTGFQKIADKIKRGIKKLVTKKKINKRKAIEEYKNQYNMNKCKDGFQTLILSKKAGT
jgi:2-polyprenyl-3-methyl-5-hydroxy-6-metoxy-1,4-benzoquinol methylase